MVNIFTPEIFFKKILQNKNNSLYLHTQNSNNRARSSAGLEHPGQPGGSKVQQQIAHTQYCRARSSAGLEHLPYKQGVEGSNPSAPTGQAGNMDEVAGFFVIKPWHSVTFTYCTHKRLTNIT